jgi:hypothetical protein
MEDAIINVVREAQGDDPDVQLRESELESLVIEAYPHLRPRPGQVGELVRYMNCEGKLRLLYAEGDVLVLRVP